MTLDEAVALIPPGCDWSINSRHHASVWVPDKAGDLCWTVQDDNVVEALAKAAKQARVALGLDPDPPNPAFHAGVEKLRDSILEHLRDKPTSLAYSLSSESDAVEYAKALAYRIQRIADELLKTE